MCGFMLLPRTHASGGGGEATMGLAQHMVASGTAMRYCCVRMRKALAGIIILALGALMGILCQDELFRNFCLSLEALAFLIPFLLVVALIALIQRMIGGKIGGWLSWLALIGASSALSILIFLGVGGGINAWKVSALKNYVAHAVPVLDKIKAQKGSYPSTLPSSLGEPPSLLRDYGEYSSDGQEFRFEYVDEPAGWAGGEGALQFNSSDRKWINDR
jgi:hypothetical protein